MKIKPVLLSILVFFACMLSSCIYMHTAVRSVNLPDVANSNNINMRRTSKVQLTDGSLILFEEGFQIHQGKITGAGKKYDMTCEAVVTVSEVSFEMVKSIIYYDKVLQPSPLIFAIPTVLIGYITLVNLLNE